jgi:hypothetical protein
MLTKNSSKKEVRRAWIERLRSGWDKKATGHLHFNGAFCVLGVLCDLAVQAKVIPEPKMSDAGRMGIYADEQTAGLPKAVLTWAGIRDSLGGFSRQVDGWQGLAQINDGTGKSLAEIADVIAECPTGLFTECNEEEENVGK